MLCLSTRTNFIMIVDLILEELFFPLTFLSIIIYFLIQTTIKFTINRGCNRAAIRFPPSIDWIRNKDTKNEFPQITWLDLTVLAGQTAIEASGGKAMPFCGGRADSTNGLKSDWLELRIFVNSTYHSILYDITNKVHLTSFNPYELDQTATKII